jgi:hypothetical protein
VCYRLRISSVSAVPMALSLPQLLLRAVLVSLLCLFPLLTASTCSCQPRLLHRFTCATLHVSSAQSSSFCRVSVFLVPTHVSSRRFVSFSPTCKPSPPLPIPHLCHPTRHLNLSCVLGLQLLCLLPHLARPCSSLVLCVLARITILSAVIFRPLPPLSLSH